MKGHVLIALAAVGGGLAAASAYATNGDGATADTNRATRIHLMEHAVNRAFVDESPAGDSSGDLLTFHNPVFDRTDSRRVGRTHGECTRIVAGDSWECRWTTFLRGGKLTVEGPFFDTRPSVLAVTGGTGRFRDARGQLRLEARSATVFSLVFTLVD
jgi:allene oxide cyclase